MDPENKAIEGQDELSLEENEEEVDTSGMFNSLKETLLLTQNNFAKGYESLANNLHKTYEITNSMSKLMEMFLLSSLNIESRIESSDNLLPILNLKFCNRGALPIPGIIFNLLFMKINKGEDQKNDGGNPITIRRISNINNEINENGLHSCFHAKESNTTSPIAILAENNIFEPIVLQSNTNYTEKWAICLPEFCRYNIKVIIKFKSPHTGQDLIKEHLLSVYFVDQMLKQVSTSSNNIDSSYFIKECNFDNPIIESYQFDFNPRIIRSFFKIAPTLGLISNQTWFLLRKEGDFLIVITLADIEQTYSEQYKTLKFNCFSIRDNGFNGDDYIPYVIEELNILFKNKI